MEDCTESHQAEINKKIRANDKLRKILTNMPEEHKSLIYGDSLKAKMQSLDDEKVALLAAKRQFLPLQSRIEKQKNYLERKSREIETKQQHRLEILQKWIEADQELDAAHAKQVQAKHEMSILVAEQTAENAKAVNQGTSGIQSLSSPSNPDSDAQQTILSVFKFVLSMQNMGCHSVAEQLMQSAATDEEVKKISQIMAQTVRKLEGGSNIPEPGIEMPKLACEVVVLDAELPSCIPGYSSMDIEGQEAIKRSLSNAATEKETFGEEMQARRGCLIARSVSGFGSVSSQYLSISRFPELAKRRIQVCLRCSEAVWRQLRCNWPMGSEVVQQERSGVGTTVRTSW